MVIKRVGVMSCARISGIGALLGVGAVIAFPVLYGAVGFIGGALSALYNWISGFVGSLQLEVE